MNRFKNFSWFGVLAIFSLVVMSGCGSDEKPQGARGVDKLIDTVSAKIAETVVKATFANAGSDTASDEGEAGIEHSGSFDRPGEIFADVLVYDKKLFAVFDGGVLIHDLKDGSNRTVAVDDFLEAIVLHDGSIYVGGKQLYILEGDLLRQQSDDYVGAIRALLSYDHRLMVGTETGLYIKSVFGRELLMEDVSVTALTAEWSALWIGTENSGLYRWDGTDVKRRRLLRDSTMFDQVNTLDFKHNHLYVGSSRGLHIFDGGRWLNLSTEDGLPSDNVTSIDASDWVVYIGSDAGVVSYYDNKFSPVNKLAEVGVNWLRRSGGKLYAATDRGEIVAKSRTLLKTLVEPAELVATTQVAAPVEPDNFTQAFETEPVVESENSAVQLEPSALAGKSTEDTDQTLSQIK